MYLNRYKFTRMKDHFQVKDKKMNTIETLPLNFDNLSEKQKKAIKKSMIFSKIISPIFLPLLVLIYSNRLALLLILISRLIDNIDTYLWESLSSIIWVISYIIYIIALLIFILEWAKRWYKAKSYYILKKAYENK